MTRTLFLSLALALALIPDFGLARAAGPSVSVKPARVRIGAMATVQGTGLTANSYVAMVLRVPRSGKALAVALVQTVAKTDGRGNLRIRIRVPVVTHCGPALLYVGPLRRPTLARAPLVLSGCKASGSVAPPPPPGAKKKP